MIVSHRHKFIFLRTKKAAGSSIAATLGPLLGDDDIVSIRWPLRANSVLDGDSYETLLP